MTVLHKKIIEVSEKEGFPTELKVASILSSEKWSVSQNIYFLDKDEAKGRELDISAHRGTQIIDHKPEITVRNYLCVEVKKTKNPWIFYISPRETVEVGGYSLLHWNYRINRHVLSAEDIESKRIGAQEGFYARSYCDLNGRTDAIRSAVLSSVKSAIYDKEHCNEQYSDTSHDICFFTPVVVVDGTLFKCWLNDKQELQSEEVKRVFYRQNYLSENYGKIRAQVDIIALSEFKKYLSDMSVWRDSMLKSIDTKKHLYSEEIYEPSSGNMKTIFPNA